MELDIFLPQEQLAFEYQGEQHYQDLYFMGHGWQQRQRDHEKEKACQENDITLIEIPFWWDKKIPSLVATIHKQRADLIPSQLDGEVIATHLFDDCQTGLVFLI